MSIKCDEHAIAKLIGTEVRYFQDEKILATYIIDSIDKSGFTLKLFISVYEEKVILNIHYRLYANAVIRLPLHEVLEIKTDTQEITFIGKTYILSIGLIPTFSLSLKQLDPNKIDVKKDRSIRFDKYDLIELLNALPEVINEEEGTFKYVTPDDKAGFSLTLIFSKQRQYAQIILRHRDLGQPIYDFTLSDVSSIQSSDKRLKIYRDNNQKEVLIYCDGEFTLNAQLSDML